MSIVQSTTSLLRKSTFGSFGSGLLHLFYPRLCEGCRKPLVKGEDVICIRCETFLARTNYHHIQENETASRLSGRIPFVSATSFAYFAKDSLMQHLIHGLKYKGKEHIGVYLGRELGRSIGSLDWQIDAIVPVPLYKKKQFTRGYNQSILIAEGISRELNVPVLTNVITRIRHTESQTDKSREERINNVNNAFALKDFKVIEGKHLLLVDDVLTTGATLEACSLTLLATDGIRLSIATVGIATD
jgi:ComF family protein